MGLIDMLHERARLRHLSPRTEKAYTDWVLRFVHFHGRRHPRELAEREIERFLTDLAVTHRVSASTQNQALAALLFLYREVLGLPLGYADEVVRAKRPARAPEVMTLTEVTAVIARLEGVPRLAAMLLYGSGLRVEECLSLRVKDLDFAGRVIVARSGKGNKDRRTMLPTGCLALLRAHLVRVQALHERDLAAGHRGAVRRAGAEVPGRRERLGVAVGLPGDAVLCRGGHGPHPPASPGCLGHPARREAGGARGRADEARELSHLPALIRDAPA
jgi:integrase